jgi:hypothetical protein
VGRGFRLASALHAGLLPGVGGRKAGAELLNISAPVCSAAQSQPDSRVIF